MAKKWYPVIDYSKCVECGTCVEFCGHGVYDKKKKPSPVVVYPDGCVDHCHGCQAKCQTGAISYVGDNGGSVTECGCSCKK
jgi:NAD-dependent dihydropyrimidine dehydrogenase PreA subunit